jgi:crotonobetainyl-CoA:carnitine CoA-transferase CaiB-like acyl-CoA transferase
MTVEERRRIALHRAAAGTWGEEVADTLVELVAPSGHELATRADVQGFERRMDERFATMDARWEERFATMDARWEERFATMDARWEERFAATDERLTAMDERWDIRLESLEHRLTATFERRIADAITSQTRTLVFSQLAALVVIAGLAFGLR